MALSHNSYAQIVAARLTGVRTVTAMDYEHQPANHLAFRLAHTVLLPEALAGSGVRRQGATPRKCAATPGLKEEIYLGDFEPDPRSWRPLESSGARTAWSWSRERPRRARSTTGPRIRCSSRRCEGVRALPTLGAWSSRGDRISVRPSPPSRCRTWSFPERALDARSLMHSSDLILGAGGTMTREGALLGVPTVSLFAGRTAAVDRWLEDRGALRRVEHGGRPAPDPAPLNRASRSRRATSAKRPAGGGVRDGRARCAAGRAAGHRRGSRAWLAGPPTHARDDTREAIELARRLARWGDERGWRGTDPYEGLSSTRRVVGPLKRTPLGRRLLIQAVKRSPLDLRPVLGIEPKPDAASVAWSVSALAHDAFLGPNEAEPMLGRALELLEALRSPGYEEPCWGYISARARSSWRARIERHSASPTALRCSVDPTMSVNRTAASTRSRSAACGRIPATRRISSAQDRMVSGVHAFPASSRSSAPGISDATSRARSESGSDAPFVKIVVGTCTEGRSARTLTIFERARATSGVQALRLAFAMKAA